MDNNTEQQYRFDDRVVLVTGAGQGLGKSHAKLFASLGAKVVVNDIGVNRDGSAGGGSQQGAADSVVSEIIAAGGEAVANGDSVERGERIVEQALDHYGRIDVVVNNAGIIRDRSFHKMALEDWQLMQRVHLEGAYRICRAAWPLMRAQQYGRLLFTASAAGIYGNFGQANYSAAKLGLYGLNRTLSVEGAAKNIRANTIAPMLDSRMIEGLMPDEYRLQMKAELVSPLAAFLCHEICEETGSLYEVGAGWYGKVRWQRSKGVGLPAAGEVTLADIADNWDAINSFEDPSYPDSTMDAAMQMLGNLEQPS